MIVFLHIKKWVSKLLLTVVFAGACVLGVQAQGKTVTGTVKDTEGTTMPGVSVFEKGTSNGTTTDADGKFTLSVSTDNAVLSFKFLGMKVQEIAVDNRTTIEVTMEAEETQLQEFVMIGYGEVERKDLTTSVSSVNAKQLKDIPINSAAEALAGRLAGVQVIGTEGAPNAEVLIRVRGGGSITQDNSPIYVVDGIQVENALSVLSPQDIESIDVLKDASATAIYGARGSNGVVIITTKGGRSGKTVITYSGLYGVRQLANKLDVMKPYDFVMYQYDRSRGSTTDENNFRDTYGFYEDLELYKDVPFVDWQDKVFGRSAVMQTHNVGVSGGNDKTQYNLSLTSNTEEGIMLGSDFDRKLANFKFDHRATDKIRVGFNVRYNNTVVNGAGTATPGSSATNRLRHSVKYRPLLFAGQDDTSFDPDYADQTNANSLALLNPLLLTTAEYRQRKTSLTNLSGYASYDITDHVTFKSTLGVDITQERDFIFNDSITSVSRLNGGGLPMASIRTITRSGINNSNVLTFSSAKLKADFFRTNKVDFMVGHEVLEQTSRVDFLSNKNFPSGITPRLAFGSMQLGEPLVLPTSLELRSTQLSFFSRLGYTYDDKYIVSLTLRADGSSKFAKENKWGYFPSASVAWRVINEGFMSSLTDVMSDLKLRLSYGTSGNNRIDDFQYLTQFTASAYTSLNDGTIVGYRSPDLSNNNLKWETTISKNIGIDAGFFNNRIQLSVDAYWNSTRDLLLRAVIPSTSGYVEQTQNIGETSNKGIEFQLSATPVVQGNFRWNVTANFSHNKNTIESLGTVESQLRSSGWGGSNVPADYIVKVGQSVGTMFGFVTDGFYQIDDFTYENGVYTLKPGVASNQAITSVVPRPGVIKFKDVDPDGVINDKDRTVIGNATPKFFGGINNQFTYKNFDLSVFVNFQFGNDVLNANKLEFTSGYTPNSNLLTTMNGRWRNVNDQGEVVTDPTALQALNANATIWSPMTSASSFWAHSWAVEDGSFVRINNITLGYTLPANVLSKIRISKLRLYGTVNNLAVFTNYSGYDPEVNTRRDSPLTPGVDYAAYPRSRSYILGVNLTF